jgi:hypothetical protein
MQFDQLTQDPMHLAESRQGSDKHLDGGAKTPVGEAMPLARRRTAITSTAPNRSPQ